MNIVLPIVFFAVAVGLWVPDRYQRQAHWCMAVWIALIIAKWWMQN